MIQEREKLKDISDVNFRFSKTVHFVIHKKTARYKFMIICYNYPYITVF